MKEYAIHFILILIIIIGITNMRQSGRISDLSDRIEILEQQ